MARNAYTLLEVLMATAVLALGLAAIFGVSNAALRKSVDAAELADAQLACQTKLNELLARQAPIKATPATDMEELTNWKISVQVYDSSRPGLSTVHISAQKYLPDGVTAYGVLCQLLRWVPQNKVEIPQTDATIDPIDGFEDPLASGS